MNFDFRDTRIERSDTGWFFLARLEPRPGTVTESFDPSLCLEGSYMEVRLPIPLSRVRSTSADQLASELQQSVRATVHWAVLRRWFEGRA